ncbi:MAG: M15 family metallopeptidase [Proteobacteria bacterium]|nr:M15 family metallopeptidase [Pseudomonadota bacterium]
MERRVLIKGLILGLGGIAVPPVFAGTDGSNAASIPPFMDAETARHIQEKIDNYNQDFPDDITLSPGKQLIMKTLLQKLNAAQNLVGYGRFNILSFDDLIKLLADSNQVGALSKAELDFIEEIFYFDAKKYGFYGEKVNTKLSINIAEKDIIKISGSGHFVFKGRPYQLYQELIRDVGSDIVLTSGIRSLVKQLHLFLAKGVACNGNLSRASRSLAPPGHSYHGIGDFDVGKLGWGYKNFTDQFAKSDIFNKLIELGYVTIRYTKTNSYGVRFEPWHIKVS